VGTFFGGLCLWSTLRKCILALNPLVDFLAVHRAKADLIAFDPKHRDGDVLTNRYGLANAAREN
jgi:hypothetical protein